MTVRYLGELRGQELIAVLTNIADGSAADSGPGSTGYNSEYQNLTQTAIDFFALESIQTKQFPGVSLRSLRPSSYP
ncbi:MAG: hypothetical protein QOH70_3754 [Blastocatellia bacterium]|jgi:hypothetical protein|nr:hypothetical protein [Blastocatellia bacterium]